ncbi:MAG: phosphatidylserine/phosphatidylglycerophosphate/cardiolipin synthase family protein [Kiritimatiellae bacterium]|nr:phosphatidylserine/phosphatidylglycerophosphate/cardiolipin synthase family protein [Kiritimatiellia bacterium]
MKLYELEMYLQSPRRAAVAVLGDGNISRIVPVALPLLKSEWDVVVTVTEPVGLVDRFVLRALRDFGPCTVRELDELLCLGKDRTMAALEEMIRVGSPIIKDHLRYSVPVGTEIESFQTEHEHRFAFLLNGLTGDLLPASFLDRSKRVILSEDNLAEMPWILQLRPILTGSESPVLRGLNPSKALKATEAVGIPTGFKEFCSKYPRHESTLYVLGFLFIDMSGNGLILAATEAADEITFPREYLSGIDRLKNSLVPVSGAALRSLATDGIRFNRAVANRNVLSVSISNDVRFPENRKDGKLDFAHWVLNRLLGPGWFWYCGGDPARFSYFELRPEDNRMERYLLIERAVNALSAVVDDIADRAALVNWVARFLVDSGASPAIRDDPSFADGVLDAAARYGEGGLRVFSRRISLERENMKPQGGRNPRRHLAERTFLDSFDKEFGGRIVDLVRKAKKSVFIASPVIQDDGVFDALRDAVAKGVELRVITQLGNHRTGRFDTSPEFSNYDIPRRRLAELGACVRDWDVTVHVKMVLVDGGRFLFSTANLNENSLGTGSRNAIEAAFLFEGGTEVSAGQRLFEALWEGCSTRQEKRDDRISIARVASKARVPAAGDCSIRAGTAEFLLSTPLNRLLVRRMTTLLNMAKSKIVFLAMSIYDLEKVPILFDAFMRVLARKVNVTVLVRTGAEQFKPEDWPDPSTKELQKKGLKIVEIPHLHAKGLFVDDEIGLMMSANLNPYSLGDLETSHVEMAVQAACSVPFMAKYRDFVSTLLGHK